MQQEIHIQLMHHIQKNSLTAIWDQVNISFQVIGMIELRAMHLIIDGMVMAYGISLVMELLLMIHPIKR